MTPVPPTPTIILTGFLGAGKSTVLRRVLTLPEFANSAVLINEYGDVAVDHDLVMAGQTQVAMTSTGCLCCTAGSDIRASIAEMHEAAKLAGRLPLDRIVVETTGLADMAPVVNQLVAGAVPAFGLRDHTVARHYRLAGVVTVFDALAGRSALERHAECVKQVAIADRVLVSKLDLFDEKDQPARLAEIETLLHALNPHVSISPMPGDAPGIAAAFAPRPYAPQDLGSDIAGWLDETSSEAGSHHHHHGDEEHLHEHHRHDARNEDGSFGIGSFALVRELPVEKAALAHVIDLVGRMHGANLLRLKGIVAFSDEPDTPYVVQVVQHLVHPLRRLDAWPSADRRTRLVAITHGIDPAVLERMIASMLDGSSVDPAPSPIETIRL